MPPALTLRLRESGRSGAGSGDPPELPIGETPRAPLGRVVHVGVDHERRSEAWTEAILAAGPEGRSALPNRQQENDPARRYGQDQHTDQYMVAHDEDDAQHGTDGHDRPAHQPHRGHLHSVRLLKCPIELRVLRSTFTAPVSRRRVEGFPSSPDRGIGHGTGVLLEGVEVGDVRQAGMSNDPTFHPLVRTTGRHPSSPRIRLRLVRPPPDSGHRHPEPPRQLFRLGEPEELSKQRLGVGHGGGIARGRAGRVGEHGPNLPAVLEAGEV
jgi:hypothetical protein